MLTDRQIRAASPLGRPYKLTDGRGLYLYITPKGSRLWRLKYRWGGHEKVLSFGPWPEVSLAAARDLQDQARQLMREGKDPGAVKRVSRNKAAKEAVTFEALAREWHVRSTPRWVAPHAAEVLASLERWLFPRLGALPITEIDPPLMLAALRAIEAAGALETCHRVRQRASSVFVYAIACGIGQNDPAAIVKGALAPIVDRQPMPALTDPAALQALLSATEKAPGSPVTKLALRLLALTACRSTEIRCARWEEFEDLERAAPLWRISADRMKSGREHVIPLPPQAIAIITALEPFSGRSPYVFPHKHRITAPMARGTLVELLNRCGYGGVHCAHGFRASFSSIMNERHPDAWDAIEAQLAHIVRGVRGAYLRAPFLERRRQLLAEWATLLLEGATDAPTLLLGPRR